MSFTPPHLFGEVIGIPYPSPVRPTLLIGAGMSHSLVPLAAKIAENLVPTQADIESELGIDPCSPLRPEASALYSWAGEILIKLRAKGYTEKDAKLKIAAILNVTTDPCWSAKAKVPLRGTSDRHRVIARLTREGRWFSLWSLNWDIWLERALQSVGVEPNNEKADAPLPLPPSWIRWYDSWTPTMPARQHDEQTIRLFKPHGCVEALLRGDGTFVLTDEEMGEKIAASAQDVKDELKGCVSGRSLIAAGWRAHELYLQNFFIENSPKFHYGVTIIDPCPNDMGHKKLYEAYSSDEKRSICKTAFDFPTTDDLFLWLQVRHGLLCLSGVSEGVESAKLLEWLEAFKSPVEEDSPLSYLIGWFDNFLAVWTRLCFNNKHQIFVAGTIIKTEAVPTNRRDEHIPWSDQRSERRDLVSAMRLLIHMDRNKASLSNWDFGSYPGAFWDPATQHLVVPVPIWNNNGEQNLSALKPLVESRHWAYQGHIRKVSLLGLTHEAQALEPSEHDRNNWTYELSRLMRNCKFARFDNINWINLDHWGTPA